MWRNVQTGLSAGRVQSVAVQLIVEREEEIRNFKVEEYWTIDAFFNGKNSKKTFKAMLEKEDNKKIEIKTEKEQTKF